MAHVIKLGGSLLDLPNLPAALGGYLAQEAGREAVLLVGGGAAAEHVRAFDRLHPLGEAAGHWLAVRAMQLNAQLIAQVLNNLAWARNAGEVRSAHAAGRVALIEPLAYLKAEEAAGRATPHRWSFTSDSIAAHIAHGLAADRLTLLKSTLPTSPCDAPGAAAAGVVDSDFPAACAGLAWVELVNLRATRSGGRPPTLRLRSLRAAAPRAER